MRCVAVTAVVLFMSSVAHAGEKQLSIVGSKFTFDYGDSAYEISIRSETKLHWKLVKGQYDGPQEDTETYYLSRIAPGILFVSWVEASGLGLYNVLNFNDSTLTTHARQAAATHVNSGKVIEHP